MVRVQYYIGNKYIGSAELTYRLNRWDYITIKDQRYRVTKCESIMQDNTYGSTDYTNDCQSIELEVIKELTITDLDLTL